MIKLSNLIFEGKKNKEIDLKQYTIELIGFEGANVLEDYFSYMINVGFVKILKNMKDSISVSSEYVGYYFEKGSLDEIMFFIGSNETKISLELYYRWLKQSAEVYLKKHNEDYYIVNLYLNDICKD